MVTDGWVKKTLLVFAGLASCLIIGCSARQIGTSSSEKPYLNASQQDMQWWRQARFGMFISWGPVTLTGQEIGWSRGGERRGRGGTGTIPVDVYDNLYKKWKPDNFNARKWVKVAKDAGAKYIIFLVKHHDGFCLYDTKLTDYKSTSKEAAWQHDAFADIAKACHETGMGLFIYYSQPDWRHPDYQTENHHRYIEYLHGQIRELLTRYGRIDGIWFDGLDGVSKPQLWDSDNLFKMIRQLQPHIIINDRCGFAGDYDTPEQNVGKFQTDRPWESAITLGTQWAWKPDDRIKSPKQCIQTLVKVAGRDGNLVLNTNPTPDGRIEPRQVERFEEIGAWLKKYGQSIYGTRGGPFLPACWGAATYKDNKIYVHILNWRSDTITLPPIQKKIIGSVVLTGGTAVVKQNEKNIEISVPENYRQDIDTIVVLELDGKAADAKPAAAAAGLYSMNATASNTKDVTWYKVNLYAPERAFDDNFETYWTTMDSVREAWLELDMGEPVTFDGALISETVGEYVRKFELQYKQGDRWLVFAHGTKIGEKLHLTFEPVTARFVRLNIVQSDTAPQISEFQLFAPGYLKKD